MKVKEIIERVVEVLKNIEGAVAIPAQDFTEEREPNMIVVGIRKHFTSSCEPVSARL